MNSEEFKKYLSKNPDVREKLKNDWVKIGKLEYIFSPAFGGERINVLYREPQKIQEMYSILLADDVDFFYK